MCVISDFGEEFSRIDCRCNDGDFIVCTEYKSTVGDKDIVASLNRTDKDVGKNSLCDVDKCFVDKRRILGNDEV